MKSHHGAPGDACNGKRRYSSYNVADEMAKRTRRQTEEAVAAYHCPHCHGFHVGTQNNGAREYRHRKIDACSSSND